MNYELTEGIWSCEQDDGPRIVREVVIAGDEAVLVVDTGLPGVGQRRVAPARGTPGRAGAHRAHHAPRQRPPREARRSCWLRGPARACSPGLSTCRSWAIPSASSATATRALPCTTTCRSARRPPSAPSTAPGRRSRAPRPCLPDARLELGGRTVVVVPTPGHSPGHVSAWVPDAGLLVAADAIMGNGIPTRDGGS